MTRNVTPDVVRDGDFGCEIRVRAGYLDYTYPVGDEDGSDHWQVVSVRPVELFREGRRFVDNKGVTYQTGTVVVDGAGYGRAWRI